MCSLHCEVASGTGSQQGKVLDFSSSTHIVVAMLGSKQVPLLYGSDGRGFGAISASNKDTKELSIQGKVQGKSPLSVARKYEAGPLSPRWIHFVLDYEQRLQQSGDPSKL